MTSFTNNHFTFKSQAPEKGGVVGLQEALTKIGLEVAPAEANAGLMGPTTKAAIKALQKRSGLPVSGKVTTKTVDAINTQLTHAYFVGSKKRTSDIQTMLARVGHPVDSSEAKAMRVGTSTQKSLAAYAAATGVPFANGQISDALIEKLQADALTARFSTKTQIAGLQRVLGRVDRIAKLDTPIAASELKQRALGASSQAAIRAFQEKYGLPVTGQIDTTTYDRLVSVAASKPTPPALLSVKTTDGLKTVVKSLRLNMTNERVGGLQRTLAFLGYPIDQKEFATRTFGKTTREAVISYQRAKGLPLTGHVEGATKQRLNADLQRVLPPVSPTAATTYSVRGSVRDSLWQGKAGVRVQAWQTALRADGTLLAERKTSANGFFNIPYEPPRDPVDGLVKKPFELQVRVLDGGGAQTAAKVTLDPSPIVWVNFTDGEQPYLGTSEWETELASIVGAAGAVAVADLKETVDDKELTYVALHSGLDVEEVMRVVLSHLVSAELADPALTPDAVYAFVGQNYPSGLPGDLVESTASWTLIDQLVERAAEGVVFMDDDAQAQAFAQAARANLIPIKTAANQAAILAALASKRQTFALQKPILVGNGTLQSLLAATPTVPAGAYTQVADAFLANRGMGAAFWDALRADAAQLGGAQAVSDLYATTQLGAIAKHHEPTFTFLQAQIANPADQELKSVSDTAKLTHDDWEALIAQNGNQVPDGLPGDTAAERIAYYATTLQQQAERIFPTHALAARAAASNDNALTKLGDVQDLLHQNPGLDLSKTNVAAFVKDANVVLDPDVAANLKVLQRVQRITGDAATGAVLLDQKLHHSAQIVYMGQERFTEAVVAKAIAPETALNVYGRAELQYALVLARLGEYRGELHVGDPAAIAKQTYTAAEQQELAGDVPDLEALFGAMDFCSCSTCQSLYGPAAYLSDTLRFIDSHLSEQPPKTVREVLFDRRPDLGNIKLNCQNTETPMPYIDLVCEVLEAAVAAPDTDPDFSFQTTRSEEELRAFPENVRTAVYDELRSQDYPLDAVFDLWQQETRVWLAHLGVPRWQFMSWLQTQPEAGDPAPTDESIAGEYFGLSSHETSLITTAAAAAGRQTAIWGLDATQASIGVEDFLTHSKLDYEGLLQLMQVHWVNGDGGDPLLEIVRPSASGDLSLQTVSNLSADRLDRIHRFLRLWRRTSWKMWELDLLLRAERLGNGTLDGTALARLKGAKQLQDRLRIGVDELLAFFGQLNSESRTQPDDTTKTIDPYYVTVFQNPRVTDPVDAALALPLAAGAEVSDHRTAIATALGISDADFDRIAARPDAADLTVATLSRMVATVTLARTMSLTIERLFMLEDLGGIADVFGSPQDTLDFLELRDWAAGSGFAIDQLDYLLDDRPDSPYGLRDDVVAQLVDDMRDARIGAAPPDEPDAIATNVASAIGVTKTQAQALLSGITAGGKTLLETLSDPALVARTTTAEGVETYTEDATPANFPDAFNAFRLLQKVAMVLSRQKLTSIDDLAWLLEKHAAYGLLDLAALPVSAPPGAPLFPSWLALTKWLDLHARYPEPENVTLRGIFDAAEALDAGLHATLEALTQWPEADIDAAATALGLSYAAGANDYLAPETYLRLERVTKAVKRLGVAASTAIPWADRDDDGSQAAAAQETRATAKAKYDTGTWLAKAAPLYDTIREQQRDALISYLIETAQRDEPVTVTVNGQDYANPARWRDSDDMLRYFCIDVEMGSAQLTSRIKQAIGSVQMFVQRCFLNLEQPYVQVGEEEKADAVTLNSWRQWEYMKNYGVWVAARQVFFYPENWLEPELRDDKTPFFEELESELQQNDMTDANAETAIRHYLEKIHEVSRLAVLGAHHEVDADVTDGGPTVNVLHVVARTKTDPAVHYYRKYDFSYGTWSAWEKIDVDVAGEHLLPVVYNRKLWLFWLVFNERPQKVKKQPKAKTSDSPTDSPAPPKQLEIQLAWSHRTPDGWTAKKLSKEKLVHPWERPTDSYHLKSRYKSRENLLWLDLYLSTSPDFNNAKFYDPFSDALQRATASPFDETSRPWHSSSFVFDGGVTAVKMKALRAFYHLVDQTGQQGDSVTMSDSFTFVHGAFGPSTRELLPLTGKYEIAPRLPLPDGMHYRVNRLANNIFAANPNKLNVLELSNTRTVAQGAKGPFELVFSQDQIRFDTAQWGAEPFIYQDPQRSFFVKTAWETVVLGYNQSVQRLQYDFFPFFHPYSELFLRELDRSGVDGVLTRRIQRYPGGYFPGDAFNFAASYVPTATNAADATAATDVVDFAPSGAYAAYNWETFFHVPLLIASRLSQNQRFEEAMKWFHYIFDPTNVDELSSPQRYWVTRPFFEMNSDEYRQQRIENLLADLGANLDQIRAWKNDPFNPHKIARYRPVAYQKNVVMKYIDNLIAWGDQLFGQDTLESINQATLLYSLAQELLGRRPQMVPPVPHEEYTWNELIAHGELDPLGNESVAAQIENLTPPPESGTAGNGSGPQLPVLDPMYFAIPPNEKLLGYWDTVADRLFKIRHSLNIQGVFRQLPLFDPPIDPALLVKAAAAGIDIGDIAGLTGVGIGPYRYRTLVATAIDFTNEVKSLGDKLLSALEKRDAEALSLLRSANGIALLQAQKAVKQSQIAEEAANVAGLEQTLASAQAKSDYYGGRDFINAWEGTALGLAGASALAQTAIALGYTLAGGLKLIPNFVIGASGFGGSPVASGQEGGTNIGESAENAVKTLSAIVASLDKYAGLATTMGTYQRRQEDWDYQKSLADIDIQNAMQQIAAAQIKQTIAQQDSDNLDLQIQQSQAEDDFMHGKYTNQQLYDWMVTQIATVYFQAYQLAYDMARRAESALQVELGDDSLSFIQFGYWDSLKKGLLAGDKLATDLRRMESSFFANDSRDLELTKHISLAQTTPLSLLALRDAGQCTVQLPEWLYDMDFPGHYRRRIKSVAMTVPAVVGPYGGVHATLTLTRNMIRVTPDLQGQPYGDPLTANGGDTRFVSGHVAVTSIATSHGQNDNGMFELSFSDERYFPFEGAGAVSEWTIAMPKAANAFDFSTISDVILHVRYTANPGDVALANAASANLGDVLPASGARLFALKNEFADDWYRFLNPAPATDQTLTLNVRPEQFPFFTRGKTIKVAHVDLFLEGPAGDQYEVKIAPPGVALPANTSDAAADPVYGNVPHFEADIAPAATATGAWTLQIETAGAADMRSLTADDLTNAYLVVHFQTT